MLHYNNLKVVMPKVGLHHGNPKVMTLELSFIMDVLVVTKKYLGILKVVMGIHHRNLLMVEFIINLHQKSRE